MTTYFISGPMRGIKSYNFPAFDVAAGVLRALGHEVLSPADHDRESGFDPTLNNDMDGFDLQAATRWDLKSVLRSDAVVLLPGWEKSEGAAIEIFVANAVGVELLLYPSLTPIGVIQPQIMPVTPSCHDDAMESITQEAHRLVSGPRQGNYGHPYHDFTRTGRLMGAIIGELKPGENLTPKQVGLCMEAVKISREVNSSKRDNRVDGIGYWECIDLVDQYEREMPA